ncbi:Uncharacterised protein [uncultured archaeon]|nr:Uncharacterised protein [uncultured archaeon]
MFDLIVAAIGGIGGAIGAIGGGYTLYEKWYKNKPRLGFEFVIHGTEVKTNGNPSEPDKGYTEIAVAFDIGNIGGESISIHEINLYAKEVLLFPKSAYVDRNSREVLGSFILKAGEIRNILITSGGGARPYFGKQLGIKISVHYFLKGVSVDKFLEKELNLGNEIYQVI